jgi:putative solute:sodium symporter small subunit
LAWIKIAARSTGTCPSKKNPSHGKSCRLDHWDTKNPNSMSHIPTEQEKRDYWSHSIKWVFILLSIWFLASFGCGILFRVWLDENFPKIGNAPFGFWMAQQGSIITFILILIAYAKIMAGLEKKLEN